MVPLENKNSSAGAAFGLAVAKARQLGYRTVPGTQQGSRPEHAPLGLGRGGLYVHMVQIMLCGLEGCYEQCRDGGLCLFPFSSLFSLAWWSPYNSHNATRRTSQSPLEKSESPASCPIKVSGLPASNLCHMPDAHEGEPPNDSSLASCHLK